MSNSFETPWVIAHQVPLSVEFLRQEYWSGLPLPPPGDLPDPGIEPLSPALQAILYRLAIREASLAYGRPQIKAKESTTSGAFDSN